MEHRARTSKLGTRLNFCIIAPGTTSEEGKKASKGSVCFGLALTFLDLLVPHGDRLMESASHDSCRYSYHLHAISLPDELKGRYLGTGSLVYSLRLETNQSFPVIRGPNGPGSCLRRQQHWGPSFHSTVELGYNGTKKSYWLFRYEEDSFIARSLLVWDLREICRNFPLCQGFRYLEVRYSQVRLYPLSHQPYLTLVFTP